jgi:hypothetical protein
MSNKRQPPNIKFYEEEYKTYAIAKSRLTRIVRASSFGLIKTDTQATLLVIFLMIIGMAATFAYLKANESVPPTTYYEVLPQESIGSAEGLPPVVPEQNEQ